MIVDKLVIYGVPPRGQAAGKTASKSYCGSKLLARFKISGYNQKYSPGQLTLSGNRYQVLTPGSDVCGTEDRPNKFGRKLEREKMVYV